MSTQTRSVPKLGRSILGILADGDALGPTRNNCKRRCKISTSKRNGLRSRCPPAAAHRAGRSCPRVPVSSCRSCRSCPRTRATQEVASMRPRAPASPASPSSAPRSTASPRHRELGQRADSRSTRNASIRLCVLPRPLLAMRGVNRGTSTPLPAWPASHGAKTAVKRRVGLTTCVRSRRR